MTSVDDFVEGASSLPLIKINSEGGKLIGDVIQARLVDERDYDTGDIVRWDDGNPRKQLVLDIRIDWAASIDVTTGKDGVREETGSYYCRFAAFLAVRDAVQKTGIKMSDVGRIAIARTKDGDPRSPRHKPPQQFVAQVMARTAAPDVDNLMDAGPRLTAADI
jgi:hypothetical protein